MPPTTLNSEEPENLCLKSRRPRILPYPGPPAAVIYIRLLVPFAAQNLLNEFLGQPEGVLRDAATVG